MNEATMCPDCKRRQGWDGHPYMRCGEGISTATLEVMRRVETDQAKRTELSNLIAQRIREGK